MEQLTTMEASFLETEDADRRLSLAIGALAIIDGPIPGREKLIATLSERTRAEPRFTHVVRKHPLEYAAPEWIDDANFDITHHIRWAALPQPGDEAALFRGRHRFPTPGHRTFRLRANSPVHHRGSSDHPRTTLPKVCR